MKLPSTRWLRSAVIGAAVLNLLVMTGLCAHAAYSLYKTSHDNPAEQQKAP
jgi:hypothetical protein